MDLYSSVSQDLSRLLTQRYSSSFSLSSRLFSHRIRPHIYAIYGLVRIADEIVDTYHGADQLSLLDELETEVYRSLKSGYSTNPIVHAFCVTARQFGIKKPLISPFFDSMRIDAQGSYTPKQYKTYIYGSAEVVGLMCLKVFCAGDEAAYDARMSGAKHLGAAYQKINFLRDFAADYRELERVYFPGVSYEAFSDADRDAILADIATDLAHGKLAIATLPPEARRAVMASYTVYGALVEKLCHTPAEMIKTTRVRIGGTRKFWAVLHSLTGKVRP